MATLEQIHQMRLDTGMIEAGVDGGPPFIEVARTDSDASLRNGIIKAQELLKTPEYEKVDKLHIYRSYKSPGPRRRFVGFVTRDGFHDCR